MMCGIIDLIDQYTVPLILLRQIHFHHCCLVLQIPPQVHILQIPLQLMCYLVLQILLEDMV